MSVNVISTHGECNLSLLEYHSLWWRKPKLGSALCSLWLPALFWSWGTTPGSLCSSPEVVGWGVGSATLWTGLRGKWPSSALLFALTRHKILTPARFWRQVTHISPDLICHCIANVDQLHGENFALSINPRHNGLQERGNDPRSWGRWRDSFCSPRAANCLDQAYSFHFTNVQSLAPFTCPRAVS